MDTPDRPGRRRLLGWAAAAAVTVKWRRAIAEPPHAATSAIAIDNFSFSPASMQVDAGTEVTWANHDDIPHTIVCPMLGLHSHVLDTDETFAYRFDRPGRFDYFCSLHPHMRGNVTVR